MGNGEKDARGFRISVFDIQVCVAFVRQRDEASFGVMAFCVQ